MSMKKKKSFATEGKPPPFRGGLDWDAIMRNHRPADESTPAIPAKNQLTLAEVDRANRGSKNYYGEDKPPKPSKSAKPKEGRQVPFDLTEAIRLYTEEHLTPQEIILKLDGVSTDTTLIKYLKKAGVYEPMKYRPGGSHSRTRAPKRPKDSYTRKDVCVRGHDMTLEGARYPSGSCRECKREDNLKHYDYGKDKRNPANGGKKPPLTADQRATQTKRQRELRSVQYSTCPECPHSAAKHYLACGVRDCGCSLTNADVKALWAQIQARGNA